MKLSYNREKLLTTRLLNAKKGGTDWTKVGLAVAIVAILVITLGPSIGGLFNMNINPPTPDVTLQVQTNNAFTEAVFSPAGAAVVVWDIAGNYLGPMTEDGSNDGKWTTAFTVPALTQVIIKVTDSGSTFYTNQVVRTVGVGAAGVDRISVLDPIDMVPRSATSTSDIVGTIMTAGVEVDNSTGIATGETEMEFMLSVSANKGWGGIPYYDYEVQKEYIGAFMVLDLTTTTARATVTGNVWQHFSIGSHEYWIIKIPQIHNDGDISGDGMYTFTITFNNLVAGSGALDIGLYANAKLEDVMATSFGTNDAGEASAEAWLNIALNS